MRKLILTLGIVVLIAAATFSQFSFYLIDNFENGKFDKSKWWRFGGLRGEIVENPSPGKQDLIAESCGNCALNLSGASRDWYVGGIGTELGVDGTHYSRFQIDVYGSDEWRGKLMVELFEDDNQNYSIEQDPQKDYEPLCDDKWVAEINIQGKGFTRISIPFSAFQDVNPEIGDNIWNPSQSDGSGGLLKLQLVTITEKQQGKMDFNIDNLLLTY